MSPSDEVLLAALPGATHVARRPYPYATSCPLTELTVAFPDGTRRLLLKELVAAPGRPGDKPPPEHEAEVYRRLLSAEGIGPELLASGADWLVLELVDGVELWQVGDLSRWAFVGAWLGRLHRRFADRGAELRAAGLAPLTAEQLDGWLVRAEPYLAGRLDLAGCRDALNGLAANAPTLVHGEFYPSNVLLAGDRVVAVDWETAALGPGALDLAALVTGWDDDGQQRIVEAYGVVDPVTLDQARLALALRWIGWQAAWTPPPEHRHDWFAEALGATERLGR